MIVGAEQAVEDAGLTGQIALVGNGGSEIAVEAVRDGRWFGTAATYPRSVKARSRPTTSYAPFAVKSFEPVGLDRSPPI